MMIAKAKTLFEIRNKYAKKLPVLKRDHYINVSLVIFLTFIGSFIYQNIVSVKIYIPGLYWIPQTITYSFQEKLKSIDAPFRMDMVVFYIVGFSLNIPLLLFAYYKIDKQYTLWTGFALLMYTFWGLFYNINNHDFQKVIKRLEGHLLQQEADRVTKVEFYLTALVAGIILGTVTSFLWKRGISGGGLDVVYTYLAIKRRKPLRSLTVPVSLIIVFLNVLTNTWILENDKIGGNPIYIFFFLVNSAIFAYAYSYMLDYFYPKFNIVTLVVFSEKLDEIKVKMKDFKRTGTIFKGTGLYKKKTINIILITTTYLEKTLLVKLIHQADPDVFITVLNTKETHGNFFVGF